MSEEGDAETTAGQPDSPSSGDAADRPTLEEIEERYDFEAFGPADMDDMSLEEWEVAFDPESWVTGEALLDRVEQDLRARIDRRDVFAKLRRESRTIDGTRRHRLIAFSDEGYAVVFEDGSVQGSGTVLRDVKPSVALCSIPDYEPPEPTGDGTLPPPDAVSEGSSGLGDTVLLVVGGAQVLAGVVLLGAWFLTPLPLVGGVVALAFLLFGSFLLVIVANSRLAARFRSEEYRERLRSIDEQSIPDVDWTDSSGSADPEESG